MWQRYWRQHRDHEYGMCFPDHKNKKFYVNIPKNATNWGKLWATNNNLGTSNYHNTQLLQKGYQPIVFLRDPLDRWYTGLAEWLDRYGVIRHDYLFTSEILSLLVERVAFDEHTEEQVMFLENIDTDNAVFFRVDNNLVLNFRHYVEHELAQDPNTIVSEKVYQSSVEKKLIIQQLRGALNSSIYTSKLSRKRETCEQRLMVYYDLDYQLYNSVQYYSKGEK